MLDAGAVPAASTIDTLDNRQDVLVAYRTRRYVIQEKCIFDGGEIGSTGVLKADRDRSINKLSANDNSLLEMRLAA